MIGYGNNGEEQEKSVQIKILASYDGGVTYEKFGAIKKSDGTDFPYNSETGVSTITKKKNKVMRFVAVKDFAETPNKVLNLPDGVIEFQISRENQKDTGNSVFV